jgi:hypothetical protein
MDIFDGCRLRQLFMRKIGLILMLAMGACLSPTAGAEQGKGLEDYTCAQLLADHEDPAAGSQSRLRLMEYWATGYAAAHEKDIPGADDAAVAVVASVLEEACRADRSQTAVQAIIKAVGQFARAQTGQEASAAVGAKIAPLQIVKPALEERQMDGTFLVFENHDLHGGDFRTLKNIEGKACSAACRANQQCKAYSFDRWNRWCFLKSNVANLSFEPSSLSGVVKALGRPASSDAVLRIERRPAKAFSGSHFRKNAATTTELCEAACGSDQQCVGFTFSKSTRVCKLFDDIETIVSEGDALSGLKTQSP